jgi:CubicO group peptidase (beta-lactamase class C family)
MDNMENPRSLLLDAVEEGVFPGARLLVSSKGRHVFDYTVGWRRIVPDKKPLLPHTLFDLASLTKPLATTFVVMGLVARGKIVLDEPLEVLLPDEPLGAKAPITVRDLLCHRSGMAAWRPFYLSVSNLPAKERKAYIRRGLLELPLEAPPRSKTLYSDLGFMLLEWIIEKHVESDLGAYVADRLLAPLGLGMIFPASRRPPLPKEAYAATEDCPFRGRVLEGETHDENAWSLGGFAGHAGLFGTAYAVDRLLNLALENYHGERCDLCSPEIIRQFFKRQAPRMGTWALGWDTPSGTGSSSGTLFSKNTVGHLGFTGTSVWVDLDRRITVTFLTNRVHPTRNNERIRAFRPIIHDAVMRELL